MFQPAVGDRVSFEDNDAEISSGIIAKIIDNRFGKMALVDCGDGNVDGVAYARLLPCAGRRLTTKLPDLF